MFFDVTLVALSATPIEDVFPRLPKPHPPHLGYGEIEYPLPGLVRNIRQDNVFGEVSPLPRQASSRPPGRARTSAGETCILMSVFSERLQRSCSGTG